MMFSILKSFNIVFAVAWDKKKTTKVNCILFSKHTSSNYAKNRNYISVRKIFILVLASLSLTTLGMDTELD